MDESYEIPVGEPVQGPSSVQPVNRLDVRKKISELTDEEHDTIVRDLRNKVVYKYYKLKGNRLIYNTEPSVRQKAVERTATKSPKDDRVVYLTDNQLMMEHIFELQNKVTKLELKNKKRKNQINDILYYANTEDDKTEEDSVPAQSPQPNPTPNPTPQIPLRSKINWRSRFK